MLKFSKSSFDKNIALHELIEGEGVILIENIFDIVDAGYIPKPAPEIYSNFINKYNINPRKAIMVEDMARNLIPAANLGMKTVWVKTGQAWAHNGVDLINPDYTTDNLSKWLAVITGN